MLLLIIKLGLSPHLFQLKLSGFCVDEPAASVPSTQAK